MRRPRRSAHSPLSSSSWPRAAPRAGSWTAVTGPKWLLLGGLMSALIILSITIAGPRIGVVATTAILIAAQFGFGALIDRFGLFGVERIGVSPERLVGIALLAAGAALTLRR